mmetsp:Transcript_29315/g.80351  ORF Transcript_29315/g.80351 Transcript_29315/m.80351 type:complete len:289 (+) Transcript_29315:808-1674(+)
MPRATCRAAARAVSAVGTVARTATVARATAGRRLISEHLVERVHVARVAGLHAQREHGAPKVARADGAAAALPLAKEVCEARRVPHDEREELRDRRLLGLQRDNVRRAVRRARARAACRRIVVASAAVLATACGRRVSAHLGRAAAALRRWRARTAAVVMRHRRCAVGVRGLIVGLWRWRVEPLRAQLAQPLAQRRKAERARLGAVPFVEDGLALGGGVAATRHGSTRVAPRRVPASIATRRVGRASSQWEQHRSSVRWARALCSCAVGAGSVKAMGLLRRPLLRQPA